MIFEEIPIDKFWRYSEEWCEKNIESKYDLNKICKSSNAEFESCYFLYGYGQEIHSNIKWLNEKLKKLSSLNLEGISIDEVEELRSTLMRPSNGYWWSNLTDLELNLDVVNYELAPKSVKSAISEVLSYLEKGTALHSKVDEYLTELEESKNETDEAFDINPNNQLSKWDKIELNHVKVKQGFIYVLSNQLMPGVYKIGFTSRNPDERAKEISIKVNLPSSFKVERYWRSDDPYIVEQRIHEELKPYFRAGEFFEGDLQLFYQVVTKHIDNVNKS